jgi:hypothetical protein
MKKLLFICVALLSIQFSFAQASTEAKTYIKNLGIKQQLDLIKGDVSNVILAENTDQFNKEYDDLVTSYITSLENLMHDSYSAEDLNKMNTSLEKNEALEPIMPKDLESFQQKAEKIENEMGMSIEGIVMKYGDPVKLQEMEQ